MGMVMRTQQEILDMIASIQKSNTDLHCVQQRCLIHKLTWDNAKKFIKPVDYNNQRRLDWKWDILNKLDKKSLISELIDYIDYGFMCSANKDLKEYFPIIHIIMVYLWLLGAKYEKVISKLIYDMSQEKEYGRMTLRNLCEEIGVNWKLIERRYFNGVIL